MSQPLLQIAQDLITIESTADKPENLQKVINYVAEYFSDSSNLFIKKYEQNNKHSIVVSTHQGLDFDIILSGHLDVVHAPEHMFTPTIENGILHGRGACDMKSECAMMMKVLKDVSSQENIPSIALMLTTDEEIGGTNGTRHLVEEIGYTAQVVLVPDSGLDINDLMLTNKGILLVKVTAQGKASHGSQPWLGQNAISSLLKEIQTVQASPLFQTTDDEHHWYNTCSMNTICGGKSANQTPDMAECTLDIRYTEKTPREDIIKLLEESLQHSSYEIIAEGAVRHTDPDHDLVKKYIATIEDVSGRTISYSKSHGAIDGRFFSGKGMLTIVSRPKSDAEHTNDEWLDIASLEQLYEIYKKYLENFNI